MTKEFKGGNSRLLAKTLDATQTPVAILDRRGQIIYVNAACCQLATCEATQLVGRQCRWELAADNEPHASFLNILAPPAPARDGRLAIREMPPSRLTAGESMPVGDVPRTSEIGSPSGQLFVPILDDDQLVHMTVIVFMDWNELNSQLALDPAFRSQDEQQVYEQTIVNVRSRWANLENLHPLLGDSPAIELAMKRVQMASRQACNILICGPRYIGKRQVAQGIFQSRVKRQAATLNSGQFFPIDASLLDATLFDGMLEIFAGRLRAGKSAGLQHLVIDHLDQISDSALEKLLRFLAQEGQRCTAVGLSQETADKLIQRGARWQSLLALIADIEIDIPALRHRRADIPVLTHQFLAQYCTSTQRALLTFSPNAMNLLIGFSWPQNLRQLRSAVEDSVDQAELTKVIEKEHLPVEIRTFPSSIHSAESATVDPICLDELLEEVERTVIQRALNISPKNRAQVARWLGISRQRLLRRIHQLGLESGDSGQDPTSQPRCPKDA